MRLDLGSLQEVERWILSWGKRARVLAPPELIDRIRATLHLLNASYFPPEKPNPDTPSVG